MTSWTGSPRILLTTEASRRRDVYFPPPVLRALESLGEVEYHEGYEPLTASQLAERLPGIDVCVTHWGCPAFNAEVLENADRLRLIAHAGGSVGDLVTPAVYDRGVTVTTANSAMSVDVAEGVLAYILADLQRLVERAQLMRAGGWLQPEDRPTASLSQITVGVVGLGSIGRRLVELVAPLAPRILAFDPYLSAADVTDRRVELVSLERLLAEADVISLHASLTTDSRGMIDAQRLAMIRNDALLVNTARSGLIDSSALERELTTGRIRAVLDVFDVEPLPAEHALRSMPNVMLMPHAAGAPGGARHAVLAVEEVSRFARGEPPLHPVSIERFRLMTRESYPEANSQSVIDSKMQEAQ